MKNVLHHLIRQSCLVVVLSMLMPVAGIARTPGANPPPPGTLTEVVVTPKAHDRHLRNPGMGLILYYHPDPSMKVLPEEADVLYMTLVWHDVERQKGLYRWGDETPWPVHIDREHLPDGISLKRLSNAIARAKAENRRVAIRLVTSWQNYPNPVPDYLLADGVRLFPHRNPEKLKFKCFYEPEWWHPKYIEAYRNLIQAFGKAFDGNPYLEWVDMRYYGFWGEGHRGWACTEPWPASVNKREFCREMIDLHRASFPHTPLVVQTASDKDVPYPEGTAIDYALDQGAWMRRDGFGSFVSAPESALLQANWKRSVLIAENGGSIKAHLENKIYDCQHRDAPPVTVEALFEEMYAHHVNYLPLGWGVSEYNLLKTKKPELLKQASLKTGYRFVVAEARWPATAGANSVIEIRTTWRNRGVGRLPFPMTPVAYLLAPDGRVLAQGGRKSELGAAAPPPPPTAWYAGTDYPVTFAVTLPEALPAGLYRVAVALLDSKQEPAIALGIEGDDGHLRFILGDIQAR